MVTNSPTSLPNDAPHRRAPAKWAKPSTLGEHRLHQLSPYIGKLKSSIAADLIESFSRPGDLVVDPFCGSGTVPFEGALRNRAVAASDPSQYAVVLTRAKLFAPRTVEDGLSQLERRLTAARERAAPDLRMVPSWIRQFFHSRTLKEAICFADECIKAKDDFLLACFLGILHHQRPGFLSFPSSHLVPYLRDRKYPISDFPEMYLYRELRSRMIKKVTRALSSNSIAATKALDAPEVTRVPVARLQIQRPVDAIITSPPYMNALDYQRDNRLRLWFIDRRSENYMPEPTDKRKAFESMAADFASNVIPSLKQGGYCVLVIGDVVNRKRLRSHPAEVMFRQIRERNPDLRLQEIIEDRIPDVRRSRRGGRATKRELVLVLKRGGKG